MAQYSLYRHRIAFSDIFLFGAEAVHVNISGGGGGGGGGGTERIRLQLCVLLFVRFQSAFNSLPLSLLLQHIASNDYLMFHVLTSHTHTTLNSILLLAINQN